MVKALLAFVVVVTAAVFVTGCGETVQGFGRDVSNLGDKIQGKQPWVKIKESESTVAKNDS